MQNVVSMETETPACANSKQTGTEMDVDAEITVPDFELDADDAVPILDKKAQKKKIERNRWTDAEMEELRKYAKDYLEKRKTPNRATCRTYIQLSRNKGGVLQERTAENILKKISAMNVKARKNDK